MATHYSTCLAFLLVAFTVPVQAEEPAKTVDESKPNIVFIAIDDMNDWVGFLKGHPQAKTPNMDRLARRSVNFSNAHCVSPACSPSRLALLYGVQPFHSGLYPFYNHEKIPTETLQAYTSLQTLFRKNGYRTYGSGKIFHGYKDKGDHWDDYHQPKGAKLKYDASAGYQIGKSNKMAFCPTTNPLEDHPDYQVANYGIDVINQKHEQPYFVAVGIVKPHLPFVCPKQFFDMQDETIETPPIRYRDLADIPMAGRSNAKLSDDLKFRTDQAWGRVRRAYLACNSWVDYNVGRVVEAVEKSDAADNTIIVLWSDHGYHFGEKRSFRKFSLWEEATRVPFLIYDPRPGRQTAGECTEAVSLIHIYKTLAELADVEVPDYVDGVSLTPQLKDPTQSVNLPAITTWGRGNFTVRGDRYRYTRYFDGSEELYDHQKDLMEWENLAGDAKLSKVKTRLGGFLPSNPAPLVRGGIGLWNVIDADRPEALKNFTSQTWPKMKAKLKPKIE
ncbi:MAG: sulfatase [Planctomycetota bacterium]